MMTTEKKVRCIVRKAFPAILEFSAECATMTVTDKTNNNGWIN